MHQLRRVLAFLAISLAPALQARATGFRDSKTLAVQIALDRQNLSCNTIDGQWGAKSQTALATWCALHDQAIPNSPEEAFDLHFPDRTNLFTTATVTAAHHAQLRKIPATPKDKAALDTLGHETIQEMFAERGHLTQTALRRLNPNLNWPNPPPGSQVLIPSFTPAPRSKSHRPPPDAAAASIRISLSRREITAFNSAGRLIALFPCSIAAEKSKLPPNGQLAIAALIPDPDYTYTAPRPDAAGRIERHILPPGPNNPVGTDWIGLSLPTYGIHGTPEPERIGRAESHGCFRLANWNAARLRAICTYATAIVIEE